MKVNYKILDNIIDYKYILKKDNSFYYENDDYIYYGLGDYIEVKDLDELKDHLTKSFEKIPIKVPFKGGFIGNFNYDLVETYEKISFKNNSNLKSSNINGLLIKTLFVIDKLNSKKYFISFNDKEYSYFNKKEVLNFEEFNARNFNSNMTKKEFKDKVKKAKKYIYEGDIFQVVISQKFKFNYTGSFISLLDQITHVKSTYKYCLRLKKFKIIGVSPEILVKKEKESITTYPIAGTRPRGKDTEEDLILEKELLNDPKEKSEHLMLVDLARNDMGKISNIGSVNVDKFQFIKKYPNIMHLVSKVTGESNKSIYEIIKSFLPAGTVSGAPKIRAMEIIEDLEEEKREVYGGAIGIIGFDEYLELAITIRTMVLKNFEGYIQTGAGIVHDSIPDREYNETLIKAKGLFKLIGGKNDFINRQL